ncbi:MAG: 3-hydroxyacyl-CoA dehydrogenase NAD-binding domain-containing protein [Syntrophobacteraceae bacterium]
MAEPITQFYTNFYESPVGKIAIMTMDNGNARIPNTLDEPALTSLGKAMDLVLDQKDVKGLMLTGKPYVFAAGADLSQTSLITTFDQGYRIAQIGHSAMKRLMDLPFPTLAAINGVALGGGLEISLYCDYRTIVRNAQGIGFPECSLGILPGWGACTLVPKLLGLQKALELIIYNPLNQNRTISGPKALEMGLADRMFGGAVFHDESLAFLQDVISGSIKIERNPVANGDIEAQMAKARDFIDKKVHGAAPAPYRALDLIKGAITSWDVDRAFDEESKALGDLIKTSQCKSSIYSFFLASRYANKPSGIPDIKGNPIKKVGIIGAGLMASQLAHLFINLLGVPVVMKDVRQELVDKGCNYVYGEFKKMAENGRITPARARYLSSLVKGTTDYADFADCDFVIEAVFEQMEVKKQVFKEAEAVIRPDAILATNTSSLSVTEMAKDLVHPERVAGFHFFNPVALMPLIEIIRTGQTNDITAATAFNLSKSLKKKALFVKDSPGFLVNRLLQCSLVNSIEMVDEGASFQQVDAVLSQLGLPMTPFELMGLVGMPIAYHVMETLNQGLGPERFPLNANFKKLIDAKVPAIYMAGSKERRVDPEVEKLWIKTGSREFSPEEICETFLKAMAIEADLILKEKVVGDYRDIDLGMLLGAGYPSFMGGITMYLDQAGISSRVLGKTFSDDKAA